MSRWAAGIGIEFFICGLETLCFKYIIQEDISALSQLDLRSGATVLIRYFAEKTELCHLHTRAVRVVWVRQS